MATTDEQYVGGGPVSIVEIGALEAGSIVQMEDDQFKYHLAVTQAGQQALAEAWRLDMSKPLTDNGQPAWVKQAGLVALPGSCLDVENREGRTSFEVSTVHHVPIDMVPGKLAVHLCAYLRQPGDEHGRYPSYVTGRLTSLNVIRRQAAVQAS